MAPTPKGSKNPQQQEAAASPATAKRRYVSQSDVPRHSLEEALRVPFAISDQYGKKPTRPIDVGKALGILPSSGGFRTLAGAALAYGFTDAGPRSEVIGLDSLGIRIVSPTEEGDDLLAKREALLRPRVVREFLEKYDGSKWPAKTIGRNVLEAMGVPPEATERTLELIAGGADSLGLIVEINGQKLVNLNPAGSPPIEASTPPLIEEDEDVDDEGDVSYKPEAVVEPPATDPKQALVKNRKVFISHGSNKKIVEQLKELLIYGDFEPVVSVEKESTAKPVPDKVLGEMRSCGAGIIHVRTENTILDQEGNPHAQLNYNVLIEIGAAMALYGVNYILLVEEGTALPSNLRGLYEARYKGDVLDHDATMKLLRTFKEFKS